MIFSELVYLVRVVVGIDSFSIKSVLASLIPCNYFVILYVCLFILSPYINKLLDILSNKQAYIFVLILLILFSVQPTMVDVLSEIKGSKIVGLSFIGAYGSQYGYTIINFTLMYILGAYLRKNEEKIKKLSYVKLLLYLCVDILLITVWSLINDKTAWEYCNPLVIVLAVLVFIIFCKMNIKYNKIINTIAKAAFTVFLLHSEAFRFIGIKYFVNKTYFIMIGHIVVSSVIIYMVCWFVWWIYDWIMSLVYRRIEKRLHIPEINID